MNEPELLTLDDLKKKLSPPANCPDYYLEPLDFIPDPPDYLTVKRTESWYRFCQQMMDKGSLNKWNLIVLENFIVTSPKLLISDLPADKEIMKAYLNQIYTSDEKRDYTLN